MQAAAKNGQLIVCGTLALGTNFFLSKANCVMLLYVLCDIVDAYALSDKLACPTAGCNPY